MTIIIPVLVGILTLLTVLKCMIRQAKRRGQLERELTRIEARNQIQGFVKYDFIEIGKNDPPPGTPQFLSSLF